MHQLLNRYPLILERKGKLVILAGHHRSAAALVEGRPVLARLVDGETTGPAAMTPHLLVDPTLATSGSIDELADRLRSGSPVTVNTTDAAAAILHTCGLSDAEVHDRRRITRLNANGSGSVGS